MTQLEAARNGTITRQMREVAELVESLVRSQSLENWKAYLSWHLLRAQAPLLSKAFVEENFDFYGRTLSGQKELQPRWKRCVKAKPTGP